MKLVARHVASLLLVLLGSCDGDREITDESGTPDLIAKSPEHRAARQAEETPRAWNEAEFEQAKLERGIAEQADTWAGVSLSESVAHLKSRLAASGERSEQYRILRGWLRHFGSADAHGMIRVLREIQGENSKYARQVGVALLHAGDDLPPLTALALETELFQGLGGPRSRTDVFRAQALLKLHRLDSERFAETIDELVGEKGFARLASRLVRELVVADPGAAVELVVKLGDDASSSVLFEIHDTLRTEPGLAQRMVSALDAMPDEDPRWSLTRSAFPNWYRDDPAVAVEWMLQRLNEPESEGSQRALAHTLTSMVARYNLDSARELIDRIDDPGQRERAYSGYLDVLAAVDPERALDEWMALPTDSLLATLDIQPLLAKYPE